MSELTPEQIEEVNKLHAVVDDFASDMKTRLTAKVEQGFSGWDGGYPIDMIRRDLVTDAHFLSNKNNKNKPVDIANRAMMMWFRENR